MKIAINELERQRDEYTYPLKKHCRVCESVLELDKEDVYRTMTTSHYGQPLIYNAYRCPICQEETNLNYVKTAPPMSLHRFFAIVLIAFALTMIIVLLCAPSQHIN